METETNKPKKLYRYVRGYEFRLNPIDGYMEYDHQHPVIELLELDVIRETKMHYIITSHLGKEKRVLKHPHKKAYAYSTKEKAMANFKKRTESSIFISERMANIGKEFLELIKEYENN